MRCPLASLHLMEVDLVNTKAYREIICLHSVVFNLHIEYTYSRFHKLFHTFKLFISPEDFFFFLRSFT